MSKIANKITDLEGRGPFSDEQERTQTLYFNWLCTMVHIDDYAGMSWYVLAKILHSIEFYWTIPNDDNRASDGIHLRDIWLGMMEAEANDLGIGLSVTPGALTGGCSVFEMMVALAIRIESDVMQSDELGNRTSAWFWDMIYNLLHGYQLVEFADDTINSQHGDILTHVVMRMLDRDYEYSGQSGGLFPLKQSPDVDQRGVELWYQAQYWISENYPECVN